MWSRFTNGSVFPISRISWLFLKQPRDLLLLTRATYIGYTATNSIWGSIICTIAVSLPSLIIMITISKFFFAFRENRYVDMAMNGLKVTVTGLIGAAALLLINKNNFIDYKSWLIFIGAFLLTFKFKMDPILMIVIAGIVGYILY